MSGIDSLQKEATRRRRTRESRIKSLVGMLTNGGLGLLAGGLIEPFLKAKAMALQNHAAVVVALAVLCIAVYLAPGGEPDGRL